jgi:Flp pilus assembly protein TadG
MKRSILRNDEGASAVEFALTVPVFLALVMGAMEFSMIFFTYNSAGRASWDVARQLALNQITTSQASSVALAELPNWVRSSATVTATSSSTDPNANRFTVTVKFPAKAATPTNVLSWAYGSVTLSATSTMQQEPTS